MSILFAAVMLPAVQDGATGVRPMRIDAGLGDPLMAEQASQPVMTPGAAQTADPATPTADPAQPAAPPTPSDEIVVTARPGAPPQDPLQAPNIKSFEVVQSVDMAVTGPVARGYKKSVPGPIRSGLRNFLSNLQEPIVFLNYMLQLKPGKGAETLGRFALNSTVGVAGLFDVAKRPPINLPRRANGFGYTLGYYGVKPGPFLYLPLIGPTTVRDLAGRIVDLSVLPYAVGKPFSQPAFAIPTTVVRLVDERAQADDRIQTMRDNDPDPYSTTRENYLRTRQAEIDALRGKPSAATPGDAKASTPPSP